MNPNCSFNNQASDVDLGQPQLHTFQGTFQRWPSLKNIKSQTFIVRKDMILCHVGILLTLCEPISKCRTQFWKKDSFRKHPVSCKCF
jgi:hypothetical protein